MVPWQYGRDSAKYWYYHNKIILLLNQTLGYASNLWYLRSVRRDIKKRHKRIFRAQIQQSHPQQLLSCVLAGGIFIATCFVTWLRWDDLQAGDVRGFFLIVTILLGIALFVKLVQSSCKHPPMGR